MPLLGSSTALDHRSQFPSPLPGMINLVPRILRLTGRETCIGGQTHSHGLFIDSLLVLVGRIRQSAQPRVDLPECWALRLSVWVPPSRGDSGLVLEMQRERERQIVSQR